MITNLFDILYSITYFIFTPGQVYRIRKYEDFVNGIYIWNPGSSGFKTDWYHDVFSTIHSKGLLVCIEGDINKYNAESAQLIDSIFTFKDDISSFNLNVEAMV